MRAPVRFEQGKPLRVEEINLAPSRDGECMQLRDGRP